MDVENDRAELKGTAMLSLDDVAALLRTTKKQIHNMMARGQFPRGRSLPGLGLRWTPATVNAWIEQGLKS